MEALQGNEYDENTHIASANGSLRVYIDLRIIGSVLGSAYTGFGHSRKHRHQNGHWYTFQSGIGYSARLE